MKDLGIGAAETLLAGPLAPITHIADHVAPEATESFFDGSDKFLDNGGELGLDLVELFPEANAAVEGTEGMYHGAHMVHDLDKGDFGGALKEGSSSAWHTGMGVLDVFTGEDGEALEMAAEAPAAAKAMKTMRTVDGHWMGLFG